MMVGIDGTEKEFKAQHDLQTLIEAEKIKQDQKRLKAAMAMKRKLKKALDNVGGK